jgi:hypothetical protein
LELVLEFTQKQEGKISLGRPVHEQENTKVRCYSNATIEGLFQGNSEWTQLESTPLCE